MFNIFPSNLLSLILFFNLPCCLSSPSSTISAFTNYLTCFLHLSSTFISSQNCIPIHCLNITISSYSEPYWFLLKKYFNSFPIICKQSFHFIFIPVLFAVFALLLIFILKIFLLFQMVSKYLPAKEKLFKMIWILLRKWELITVSFI